MLDDDMKSLVRTQRLGYVASVCPDGTPNLSPKGTTRVWDDDHLVFLDLHSPGTVANIDSGNAVLEINVVDPILRKGYRFKGPAIVVREGARFEEILRFFGRVDPAERARVKAAVVITIEFAAPLVSPAYDDGTSEDEIEARSLEMYGLARSHPR